MNPDVLTLGARTVEAFDERRLGGFGIEESRWGLEHYLSARLEGLLCGWTTLRLLHAFQKYFAVTRDRAPASDESPSLFAKRLARDELAVLRRGADAGALCADIQGWPTDFGPALLFRNLDFNIAFRYPRASENLRASWERQLGERVAFVSRLERDQRERLSTSAELSGVAQNLRAQSQIHTLTIALLILTVLTIVLTVAQLTSGQDTKVERVVVTQSSAQRH
jgi:hypothetical protein